MFASLCLLFLAAAIVPPVPTGKGPWPTRQQTADFWDLDWQLGPASVQPKAKPPTASMGLRSLGASVYRQRCSACHGDNGRGDGPDAARFDTRPTNFTYGLYKLRSTPFPSIPTDLDLFTTLTRGIHGTPMLPWRQLSEKERWALVAHLKSLSPRFKMERVQKPIRIPPPPPETDELRLRGQRLYALMECATCHGDAGAADGPIAKDTRQWGPNSAAPIRDFTRGRFIRGTAMTDLFVTLQTGMDGTMMGSYNALLSEEEIWAVAAYVRALKLEHPVEHFPRARTSGSRAASLAPRSRQKAGKTADDQTAPH